MKIVLKNKGTKERYDGIPVVWGDSDLFTHTLCIGPTRCGKSALAIQQLIKQILFMKIKGFNIGLSLIEPKGDIARFAREMAEEMGITDFVHIDPLREDSHIFNVMEGDMDIVAEATVTVLKGMFGKQEQFFAIVQELSARHVTKLLKTLQGDDFDIVDLIKTLRNEQLMEQKVAELKQQNSSDDLIEFFDNELLGENKDRYRQFVMGLRAQLENLISNKKLRKVLSGKSDLNIDEHFEKGGILAINTGLAELGSAGDAFGQFAMMHLQRGAFRRKGSELTRVPHILIVDEASRYINSEVEVFLAIGAEYRVAGFFALQSGGQLEVESGKLNGLAMKRAFLASCRNRLVFGGLASEDAELLSKELGSETRLKRQNTYKNNIFLPNFFPDSYRDTEVEEPFFTASNLRYDIPRFHFVYQLQNEGQPMNPRLARGEFVPRTWKEERFWEKKTISPLKALSLSAKELRSKMVLAFKQKKEDEAYREAERKAAQELAEVEKRELTEEEEENVWEVIEKGLTEMTQTNESKQRTKGTIQVNVTIPEKDEGAALTSPTQGKRPKASLYGTPTPDKEENVSVEENKTTLEKTKHLHENETTLEETGILYENSYENETTFIGESRPISASELEEMERQLHEIEHTFPNKHEQDEQIGLINTAATPTSKVEKDVQNAKNGAMF